MDDRRQFRERELRSGGRRQRDLDRGAVYVFDRDAEGVWREVDQPTAANGLSYDVFGASIAFEGDRIATGASGDRDFGENAGAVSIFEVARVAPRISVTGSCPGEITFRIDRVTPRATVQLHGSSSPGSATLQTRICAGTELGLDDATLLN